MLNMVTKKRGFDIASLVEGDNDCDSIPRKKVFHGSSPSPGHQLINFNPSSLFSGHPPSISLLPPTHHLLNLSSNNNNNNNNNDEPPFLSAFKKVETSNKKQKTTSKSPSLSSLPPPPQLLDLSFNPGSSSSSNIQDVSTNNNQQSATSASNGRTGATMPAPPSLLPFLPPSLAALSFPQTNWCAKCNATFRMTSDLVYHMRSHHKPSSTMDPVRKKREEKLRCNICGETFRERHHLTRHMTSHQ